MLHSFTFLYTNICWALCAQLHISCWPRIQTSRKRKAPKGFIVGGLEYTGGLFIVLGISLLKYPKQYVDMSMFLMLVHVRLSVENSYTP